MTHLKAEIPEGWPESGVEVARCLACGAIGPTSSLLRDIKNCGGKFGESHGPTQAVPVVPLAKVEELEREKNEEFQRVSRWEGRCMEADDELKEAETRADHAEQLLAEAREGQAGAGLIAAERERQVNEEGWTPEHDDQHKYGEIRLAAKGYLDSPDGEWIGRGGGKVTPMNWPWNAEWFKPTPGDPIRSLVKAGALIAAEIDRLQREQACEGCTGKRPA
jgi:hypothetical protein